MKIRLAIMGASAAALALAAPALGKGPSEATINGPGLKGGGIHLASGGGDPGSGTPLGSLTEFGGFFPATFGQEPDPMLPKRPTGSLGPKYTVEYKVPGPSGDPATIRQDLYPYAPAGPVTYTKPGQSFFDDQKTRGGWFEAPPDLMPALIDAGLPRTAPSAGSGDSWLPSWAATTGIVFAILAVALATITLAARRRPRPAGA